MNNQIQIGTEIQGYKIYGIHNNHCIAKRPAPCEQWVIWTIDSDRNGVNTGRYFESQEDAEWEYCELCFDWFEDCEALCVDEEDD